MACGETGVEAAGVPTIMEYTCFAPLRYTYYVVIPTSTCTPRGTQAGWMVVHCSIYIYTIAV